MRLIFLALLFFIHLLSTFAGTRYYRASWRDDPATTMVIGWADNGTSTNATVYYGTTDFGTNYSQYPLNHGIDRTVSHRSLNNRFARLTNLSPATTYYFVIKDDQGVSARMSFRTLSDDPNVPILFISGGDTRTGVVIIEFEADKCRERRQRGNALVAKIRPDFVAFSGDFVFTGTSDSQWADWFSDWQMAIGPEGRLFPAVPVFGNHEESADIYNFFDIPSSNGYFALTMGGKLMRLYSLNSEIECNSTQLNWLTNDLQLHYNTASEPYWKAVQYHIPLVPHGEYSPMSSLISCWAPLFHQYRAKLCMEGHTHIQKITWPIVPSSGTGSDNGFIRDDANGTVYAGEGCWGAPLRNLYTYYNSSAAFNWTRNQDKFTGFFIVKVTKQKIQIQTVKFHVASDVASVQQVPASAPVGTLPAGLTYWNPSNGQIVEILSPFTFSTNANLMNLTVSQGTLSPAFSQSVLSYQVQLPYGSTQVPVVAAVAAHNEAIVSVTQAVNVTGTQAQRTATVLVTAEDGTTTKTYTVEFSVSPPSDAYLATLVPSQGTLNPTFTQTTYNYSVVLPFGTTTVPTVTATPNDPLATVTITQPTSVTGTASILVVSADQTNQHTYTVTFSVAAGSANDIVSFNITGQTGNTAIDQVARTIVVTMPTGTNVTALVPTIVITGVSVTPASGVAQDFTSPVSYTVTAADNSTKQYTASINLANISNDATLASLEALPGQLSPAFSPLTTYYTVDLPQGTQSVQINAITNDPNATKSIYPPSNLNGNMAERTAMVLVRASDGITTKNYQILFNTSSAIDDKSSKYPVTIYPNPASDEVYVDFGAQSVKAELEVYNGLGHLLTSRSVNNEKKIVIQVKDYNKGSYYVYLKIDGEVLKYRFIKN